jgi:hypothetical protein
MMAEVRSHSALATVESEIRELLQEVDEAATVQKDRWAEKRDADRRRYRTRCGIRYLSLDGESVLATTGSTRDISLRGLGLLSNVHFRRKSSLLVSVALADGKIKHLTGTVVYSRAVREGWFLTGLRFGPVDDARLAPDAVGATLGPDAAPSKDPARKSSEPAPDAATRRQQAFSMLAAAATLRTHTRDSTSKVVMLTLSADHEVRRATIPVLMQIGGQDGVISLVRLLDDPNPVIQGEAADAIGRMKATNAVGALRKLLHHRDDEVALRAAEALCRLEDDGGMRRVVRILREDSPQNRRAARVLGMLTGQEFRPNASGVAAARKYVKTYNL